MDVLIKLFGKIVSLISNLISIIFPRTQPSISSKSKPTVGIVGAGFSGVCAAIKVREQLGVTAQIFEANDDIGGTWDANRYPGCACDVPSHLYSYSFALNPFWSKTYSPQPEILEYFRGVASKYNLYDQIHLSTQVIRTEWLERENKWKVQYRHNDTPEDVKTVYFDIIFGAVGPLRIANIPEQFKGFEGTIVHTSFWDEKVDFKNKRVAVIGSGASGVQVIPELQKVASELYSYQRTPSYIVGRTQLAYPSWMQQLFYFCPPLMRVQRLLIYWIHELVFFIVFKNRHSLLAKFARRKIARDMRIRLEKQGRGDLAPLLIPRYTIGCKRVCRSEVYLEALSQNNVTVRKGSIKEVKGHSIIHEDGSEDQVDILVLATGFDVQGTMGSLKIFGRDGISLNKMWGNSYPSAFQTITVHGFPNLFILLGPNAGLGHNSILPMIEIQVDYAINSIKYIISKNIGALEPRKEAQEEFVTKVLSELKDSAWAGNCKSYYKTDKGVLFGLWSGTITSYWYEMSNPNFSEDYIQYGKTWGGSTSNKF